MRFGPVAPADAIGGVVVHTIRRGKLVLKKGTVISPAEVEALTSAGVNQVVVAALDKSDISEDVAAATIAEAVAGDGSRGARLRSRSNLFASQLACWWSTAHGCIIASTGDHAATLPTFKPVVTGEMVGTVKLIPFGVGALRDRAVASANRDVMRVAVSRQQSASSRRCCRGCSQGDRKTLQVTAERLAPAARSSRRSESLTTSVMLHKPSMRCSGRCRTRHRVRTSAIADRRRDPSCDRGEWGGHFGMPVDPGNLMLIRQVDGGLSSAPRAFARKTADWILMRMLAGLCARGYGARRRRPVDGDSDAAARGSLSASRTTDTSPQSFSRPKSSRMVGRKSCRARGKRWCASLPRRRWPRRPPRRRHRSQPTTSRRRSRTSTTFVHNPGLQQASPAREDGYRGAGDAVGAHLLGDMPTSMPAHRPADRGVRAGRAR